MSTSIHAIATLLERAFALHELVPFLRSVDEHLPLTMPNPHTASISSACDRAAEAIVHRGLQEPLRLRLLTERPALVDEIGRVLGASDGKSRHPPPTRPIAELPGREAIVEAAWRWVQERDAVVVHGIIGAGKTRVALAVAARALDEGQTVHWLRGDSIATLADQVLPSGASTGDDGVRAALQDLAAPPGSLIIIDNADSPDIVRALPWSGAVVVTTRAAAGWPRSARRIQVGSLDLTAASTLLMEASGDDDAQAAAEIAEWLGGHALALCQAAAYCEVTGSRLRDYRATVECGGETLVTLAEGGEDYPAPLTRQVQIAIEALSERNAFAARLVGVAAHFAPGAIPRLAFRGLEDRTALELDLAVAAATRSGLITAGPGVLDVHAVISTLVPTVLPPAEAETCRAVAVLHGSTMLRSLVRNAGNLEEAGVDGAEVSAAWEVCSSVFPHAAYTLGTITPGDLQHEAVVEAVLHVLGRLRGVGRFAAAAELGSRVLHTIDATWNAEPRLIRHVRNQCAVMLQKAHRFQEAQVVFADLVAEADVEPDERARFIHNLGFVRGALGDIDGAIAAINEAITIREALDGAESESVASALESLATFLVTQNASAASVAMERAAAIRAGCQQHGSPGRLQTLANLAAMRLHEGRVDAARSAIEVAIAEADELREQGHSGYSALLMTRAEVRLELADPEGATADLDAAAEHRRQHPDYDLAADLCDADLRVRLAGSQRRFDTWSTALERLATLRSENNEPEMALKARFDAALVRVAGGGGTPAVKDALRQLATLAPDEERRMAMLELLARTCFESPTPEAAVPVYEALVAATGSDPRRHAYWSNGLGSVLLAARRYYEARAVLVEAYGLNDGDAPTPEFRVEVALTGGPARQFGPGPQE